MAGPIAGYVLPQQFYTPDVALCWYLSRLRTSIVSLSPGHSLILFQYKKIKNIKNVERCMKGWHAKKYANKVEMMHESKDQHIGKAPSLHLFHTTVS